MSEVLHLTEETVKAAAELFETAALRPGQLVVVGCSTSEVRGARIGSDSSVEVAQAVLSGLMQVAERYAVQLAIQCCEHLNRALVVERAVLERYGLEEVCVRPAPKAGGSLAACAMQSFAEPVVVEAIQAHAGLDIGNTLIGMHLKRVAVPVRLQQKYIGAAPVVAARTRPKLIGGARAIYE